MTGAGRSIILASASKSRRNMLQAAGVTFRTEASGVDETAIKKDHDPLMTSFGGLAARLAVQKALAVAVSHPSSLVIGADQLLVFEGEALDKPGTVEIAQQQLLRLRGKTHTLETAVVCARGKDVLWTHIETPRLAMREFSSDCLAAYLAAEGETVTDTVGGYKIEGRGIQLFESMAGDYFAILGLPLFPLLAFLRAEGAIAA